MNSMYFSNDTNWYEDVAVAENVNRRAAELASQSIRRAVDVVNSRVNNIASKIEAQIVLGNIPTSQYLDTSFHEILYYVDNFRMTNQACMSVREQMNDLFVLFSFNKDKYKRLEARFNKLYAERDEFIKILSTLDNRTVSNTRHLTTDLYDLRMSSDENYARNLIEYKKFYTYRKLTDDLRVRFNHGKERFYIDQRIAYERTSQLKTVEELELDFINTYIPELLNLEAEYGKTN